MREVLRAIFKTGSGSGLSLLFSAIASKILAVILGPSGIGLYSMLVQIQQTGIIASTASGGPALIQGIASKKNDARDQYVATVFWLYIGGTLLTATILIALAPWIADWTLSTGDASIVGLIRWLAVPLAFGVLQNFLFSTLNGFRAIGRLAIAQVTSSATIALFSYPLALSIEEGQLFWFVILMSVGLISSSILSIAFAFRKGWLEPITSRGFRPSIDRDSARHFFSIAVTMFATGLLASLVMVAVRSTIIQHFSLSEAGIFNVAWTICMTYSMVILGSFGTYYLPTLSKTNDPRVKNKLMVDMFRVSTVLLVPIIILVIILKPAFIEILYARDFNASLAIIRWMLIADYFKAASWILGYPMVAYADMRKYAVMESLWQVGFLTASIISLTQFDSIEGVGFGFMALYVILFFYTLHYARTYHAFAFPNRVVTTWLLGLGLIILASAMTWSSGDIDWIVVLFWIPVLIAFMAMALTLDERRQLRIWVARRE
jgi:O-antigen/teichoic acid export membrane protein